MNSPYSQFQQFHPGAKYDADIQDRLYMEADSTTENGLPDDDANLIQLLWDAWLWIRQAKKTYGIPENWPVPEEE